IEVIYSGTDTERFHPGVDGNAIRAELGVSRDQFLITQVGVRSWRGNDDVLDAMAEVVAQAPDARLLFVGAPAPRIPVLLDQARARRLDGCVHVWGHREDIAEILAAADLTVDAAYAGAGLTGSLRESLAVETPVVGTMLEGIPELVREGETGLLVPPRSPEALARAILWVKAHPVEAKGMARAGRKRVEADFSTEVKVQRTEALYRHLLAARS
ncbi:MAG: glycosyltransferase family 4 protein, partial [Anaerolineae bacterium]